MKWRIIISDVSLSIRYGNQNTSKRYCGFVSLVLREQLIHTYVATLTNIAPILCWDPKLML